MSTETGIRPFQVDMPDEAITDLRRRIAATRWPSRELVADRSQGVQLATIQELARYWATDYDWRACEAKLNALPQFMTEIDGAGIHFIHVQSEHENALPLIITHGSRSSARSPTRPRTVEPPRTRSTSCCRPCPATAFPASRPRPAGTPAASRAPGRS